MRLFHFRIVLPFMALVLTATGCTTLNETHPERSATEQLLISAAADRAAQQMAFNVPKDTKVFIDSSNLEGYDSKYALGALRDVVLKQGAQLTDKREDAEIVVEVRAGALSVDKKETLVGVPSWSVPVPFASGNLALPELAFYRLEERQGVAKLAAFSYDAKSGKFLHSQEPQFGLSRYAKQTLLLFITWTTQDILPEDQLFGLAHTLDSGNPVPDKDSKTKNEP